MMPSNDKSVTIKKKYESADAFLSHDVNSSQKFNLRPKWIYESMIHLLHEIGKIQYTNLPLTMPVESSLKHPSPIRKATQNPEEKLYGP